MVFSGGKTVAKRDVLRRVADLDATAEHGNGAAPTQQRAMVSGGVTISAAMLDVATRRVVTLTTSPLTKNVSYTLTATNIVDITDAATPIAPNTTAIFTAAAVRGATNNVAEAAHFQLAYSMDIPNAPSYPSSVAYTVDNHASLGAYGRVAYYMELQSTNAGPLQNVLQYVWVSMNPFTTNINKIGR